MTERRARSGEQFLHQAGLTQPGSRGRRRKHTEAEAVEVLLRVRADQRVGKIARETGLPNSWVSAVKAKRLFGDVRLADRFTPEQLEREIAQRRGG